MSLIRQIWLLLLVTLLMAFLGSFAVWMLSSRGYLETQLRLKNADNAQSLALNLTQQSGDTMGMDLALSAMFDTGSYQRITLKDAAGRVLANRAADPSVTREQAPAWFVELVPVESVPGVAQVSDGWRAVGSVEVVSHSAFAHAQLWQGSMKTAGLLTLLGAWSSASALTASARVMEPSWSASTWSKIKSTSTSDDSRPSATRPSFISSFERAWPSHLSTTLKYNELKILTAQK